MGHGMEAGSRAACCVEGKGQGVHLSQHQLSCVCPLLAAADIIRATSTKSLELGSPT